MNHLMVFFKVNLYVIPLLARLKLAPRIRAKNKQRRLGYSRYDVRNVFCSVLLLQLAYPFLLILIWGPLQNLTVSSYMEDP